MAGTTWQVQIAKPRGFKQNIDIGGHENSLIINLNELKEPSLETHGRCAARSTLGDSTAIVIRAP